MKKITIETMSPCEAEVISRDVTGEGKLIKAMETLEHLRCQSFQAVAWKGEEYIGGVWYNLNYEQWAAEFLALEWIDGPGAAQVKEQLQSMA